MTPDDEKVVAQIAAKAANMAVQGHEANAALHGDTAAPAAGPDPTSLGFLQAPGGKPSATRLIAHVGMIAGSVALIGGLGLAVVEAVLKTGSTQGGTIALAGLGTFFTAGATKVGGAFAEKGQG